MCTPMFPHIWRCFPFWPGIVTTSTPTKLHILRYVPGSEFSGGFQGQSLLVLLVRTIAFDSHRWVRFCFILLFKGLCPLPRYRGHYLGLVELREMVCRIVVWARHYVRPEPPFCKLTRRSVLVVEIAIVDVKNRGDSVQWKK